MTEEIKEILFQLEIVARKHTIKVTDTGNIETMPASVVHELRLNNYSAKILLNYITNLQIENEILKNQLDFIGEQNKCIDKLEKMIKDYKQRNEKAVENAKEKIKRYESYIHDLKNGNYPSPTIRQERQELIFRIREQEVLLNILEGGDE